MKEVRILNADKKEIAKFTTKSTRLRDAVYKFKQLNGITESTSWEVVNDNIQPEKVDSRIPEFKDLKENTRRTYQNHLKNFFKQGGDHKSYDSIKDYYDKIPSTSKQAFLYASMLMNPNDEDLKKRIKGLVRNSFDEVREIRANRDKSDAIPLRDLQNIAKNYKTENPVNKFIAEWYAFSGLPWRADTFVNITNKKTKQTKKDLNVVFMKDKKILMNHFKTVSSHGQKEIKLTKLQTDLLKQGFETTDTNMLINMSADTLLHRVRSIFGVGLNAFRHAWITENKRFMSDSEFREYCNKLNTSPFVAYEAYNDS